jgi:hypothetical protein
VTLPEALRAVLGDGGLFDDVDTPERVNPFDLLTDADRHAANVLAQVGVLYGDDERIEDSTAAAVDELAHSYGVSSDEPDTVLAALEQAGLMSWHEGEREHVLRLVHGYAEPYKRAAYYLGLAIGWRAAQELGGVR